MMAFMQPEWCVSLKSGVFMAVKKEAVLFENIRELLTLSPAARKQGRSPQEEDLGILKDAKLLSLNGKIAWVGLSKDWREEILAEKGLSGTTVERISLENAVVVPGFVESHTHLIFAGDRSHEFEWRQLGQSYQQIASQGGGIRFTVRQTREASSEELLKLAQQRVREFVRQGVTVLEIKSGYGLDIATEERILKVAKQLKGPDIVRTYLGPHALAPEAANVEEYMEKIIHHHLPYIVHEELAERADIFIEQGYFSPHLAQAYWQAAQASGLHLCGHVEQMTHAGGTALGLKMQAQSLDHLVHIQEDEIQQLARSSTVAVLLPTSDYYLRIPYPPARQLLDAGAIVALATDYNPGTSPTQDLAFVGMLARLEMKMTLPEVIVAYTVSAAQALGWLSRVGSLDIEKQCDFVVLEGSWQELFYSVGHQPARSTWKLGKKLEISLI